MARKLILTCSLCTNFDPIKKKCKLNGEERQALDASYASVCNEKGSFVRYMHVIPDVYNYFTINEDTPANWKPDLTRVPCDKNGLPLIVKTKRGIERAIPADPSVEITVDLVVEGKVPAILTYQGQRELIYDLGVFNAQKLADNAGVTLTVLPEEEGWEGIPDLVAAHSRTMQNSKVQGGKVWLTDKPIKWNS